MAILINLPIDDWKLVVLIDLYSDIPEFPFHSLGLGIGLYFGQVTMGLAIAGIHEGNPVMSPLPAPDSRRVEPSSAITPQMLWDYLDETLSQQDMILVENALRESESLRQQLQQIIQKRDNGEHTVGAIWRRHRISCLDRDVLGSYLLNTGDPRLLDYVRFHLEVIGCPYCQANLEDLQQLYESSHTSSQRRR
jgi:hypothetical protein